MRTLSIAFALCFLLICATAFAQGVTPADNSVIATSDEDGATAAHAALIAGGGHLLVDGTLAGTWPAVESARVTAAVKFTNPTNVPIRIEELRGEFKRGAKDTSPTVYVAIDRGESIAPGTDRSFQMTYENVERYDQVSVDLSITYREQGKVHAQHIFLKGNKQLLRTYEVMNHLFNGLLPVPVGIGNYPMTSGPLDTWPSEYDLQIRPDDTGVFKIGF